MGGNQCKTKSMMDGTVHNESLENLEIDQSETLHAVEVEESEEVWTPQDHEYRTIRQKHWGQICGPAQGRIYSRDWSSAKYLREYMGFKKVGNITRAKPRDEDYPCNSPGCFSTCNGQQCDDLLMLAHDQELHHAIVSEPSHGTPRDIKNQNKIIMVRIITIIIIKNLINQ